MPHFHRDYVRPKEGRALVVGSKVYPGRKDRRHLYANAVGLDLEDGQGVDVVANLEDGIPPGFGTFAHIDCVSVLEHSRKPWKLAEGMEDVLEPDGTLLLSVPFVWRFHGYPNDYWRFTSEGVKALFPRIKWSAMFLDSEGRLTKPPHATAYDINGLPAYCRTEVLGFGVKCES